MAEGTIQLPADSTGKILRTQTNAAVAAGAHQQVVSLADSAGVLVGNADMTIRATGLAAVTATGNSADLLNTFSIGAVFFLRVALVTGVSPTLVVKIQGKDPVSATYYDIPGAAFASQAAAGAAGVALALAVHPGLPVTAGVSANAVLPRTFRAVWTLGGTTPGFTFSLGASLLLA